MALHTLKLRSMLLAFIITMPLLSQCATDILSPQNPIQTSFDKLDMQTLVLAGSSLVGTISLVAITYYLLKYWGYFNNEEDNTIIDNNTDDSNSSPTGNDIQQSSRPASKPDHHPKPTLSTKPTSTATTKTTTPAPAQKQATAERKAAYDALGDQKYWYAYGGEFTQEM